MGTLYGCVCSPQVEPSFEERTERIGTGAAQLSSSAVTHDVFPLSDINEPLLSPCLIMADEASNNIAQLLLAKPYNPEILPDLEQYVDHQVGCRLC